LLILSVVKRKNTLPGTWGPRILVFAASLYALAGAVLFAFGDSAADRASRTDVAQWQDEATVAAEPPPPAFPIRLEVAGGIPVPSRGRSGLPNRLTFPVRGPARLLPSFGDARGARSHAGVDIMAEKGTPVVAAADGVVRWMDDEVGGNCCDVALVHEGGWRTRYFHLNNDTPGTDDGRGYGIAPGLAPGVEVREGELVGFVGDSGNAERTAPHLHFEVLRPNGRPLDPYGILRVAQGEPVEGPMPSPLEGVVRR
jgi:murein DD-endopeptidase MepM/ murein hydrolase activator NlpD